VDLLQELIPVQIETRLCKVTVLLSSAIGAASVLEDSAHVFVHIVLYLSDASCTSLFFVVVAS
jgi:hypothetical protein